MQHKLVFIETQDVVETTLALDNFRRACDCGRGAVFFRWDGGRSAAGAAACHCHCHCHCHPLPFLCPCHSFIFDRVEAVAGWQAL